MGRKILPTNQKRVKISFSLSKEICDGIKAYCGDGNISRFIEETLWSALVNDGSMSTIVYGSAKLGIITLHYDGFYYFADEDAEVIEELGRHNTLAGALQSYRNFVDSDE